MQTETARHRLRELILDGTYPPGARLTETDAAVSLGMSRTPVREALNALIADGLVRPAGRGVLVATLSTHEVEDAYQVRSALEALTAELAANRQRDGRIAPADLRDLRETAATTAEATADGRFAEAVDHNRRFHRMIAELADNAIALRTLDRVWDLIHVSTFRSLRPSARPAHVSTQHEGLLTAITEGRAADAARIAREHVLDTRAETIEIEQEEEKG
jgi:DNA-binding GntR family transcriptional regulator